MNDFITPSIPFKDIPERDTYLTPVLKAMTEDQCKYALFAIVVVVFGSEVAEIAAAPLAALCGEKTHREMQEAMAIATQLLMGDTEAAERAKAAAMALVNAERN